MRSNPDVDPEGHSAGILCGHCRRLPVDNSSTQALATIRKPRARGGRHIASREHAQNRGCEVIRCVAILCCNSATVVCTLNLRELTYRDGGTFLHVTDIQLTAEEFGRLEVSTINRVRELQAMIAAQRDSVFGQEFMRELRQRQEVGERVWSLPRGQDGQRPTPDACMGCGRPSTVKIVKICDTCPERAEVCTPRLAFALSV